MFSDPLDGRHVRFLAPLHIYLLYFGLCFCFLLFHWPTRMNPSLSVDRDVLGELLLVRSHGLLFENGEQHVVMLYVCC
jgi:hypothetical protein